MNLLLFDNDALQLDLLERTLQQVEIARQFSVLRADSVDKIKGLLRSGTSIDVAIMDIDLGQGETSGIDVVKDCFPPSSGTQVIYLTGYVEYCTEVYETEHVYFLLKPATPEQLGQALDRALFKMSSGDDAPLTVVSNRALVKIKPRDISYIETKDRRTLIHVARGDAVPTYEKLSDLVPRLPARFVQPHKSFVVNMDRVLELGSSYMYLADGTEVPISQSRKKDTQQKFREYLQAHI